MLETSLSQVIGEISTLVLLREKSCFKERELLSGAADSHREKSIVEEKERLIFAPTRAENRPEFNAAPVKDRTGYE